MIMLIWWFSVTAWMLFWEYSLLTEFMISLWQWPRLILMQLTLTTSREKNILFFIIIITNYYLLNTSLHVNVLFIWIDITLVSRAHVNLSETCITRNTDWTKIILSCPKNHNCALKYINKIKRHKTTEKRDD